LPDSDQIPAEKIQAGGETLLSAIHKLINSIWNKEELPDQWKESINLSVHKKSDKTDCNTSNYGGISLLPISYTILSNIFLSWLSSSQMKLLGIISVDFDITDQLLIRFSASSDTGEKMGVRDSKSAIYILQFSEEGSIVQYSHRVWGTHETSWLIKMCLNETYSKVCIGKHLSDSFLIQSGLNKEMVYHH
jgi:hypothetical protein